MITRCRREKMARRKGSLEDSEQGQQKPKQKRVLVKVTGVEGISKTEDWCFVCKDGGTLRFCDFPECGKSYHFGCVGKKKAFLKSDADWQCDRHSCLCCGSSAIFTCHLCPNAICFNCLHIGEFIHIAGVNGFCKKCVNFALHVEGQEEKSSLEVSATKYKHFKEYYWIIKKKYGFTLDELQAAKNGLKSEKKCTFSPTLGEANVNKSHGESQKEKLASSYISQNEKVTRKRKLKSSDSSPNKKLMSKLIEVVSPVHENVRRIYLTRSVIEKLLKQPESFEARVKGTFVGIELPQKAFSNRRVCQLVQVTGILCARKLKYKDPERSLFSGSVKHSVVYLIEGKLVKLWDKSNEQVYLIEGKLVKLWDKSNEQRKWILIWIVRSQGGKNAVNDLAVKNGILNVQGITKKLCDEGPMTVKLQTKNMPDDVSIDMVSDIDFSKNTCKDLSQKVKDGLFEMPTTEEFQRMAKDLSEDIVDDFIAREMRRLQLKMDQCNEKGWRGQFYGFSYQKQLLQLPSQRLRLIKMFSEVGETLPNDGTTNEIMNEEQEIRGSEEPISRTVTFVENDKIASDPRPILKDMMDGEKQNEGSPKSIACNLELTKDKNLVDNKLKGRCISDSVQEQMMKTVNEPVIRAPVSPTTKSTGIPDDQVRGEHYTNEELVRAVDDFNGQKFVETEILDPFGKVLEENKMFDVMHDELESNATEFYEKILMREHKLDTLEAKMDDGDDGRPSLKSTTQEDTGISAAKMESLEEKIDCIAQNIKQMKEEQAQSAEGSIIHSKPSSFMDAVYNLLEPVARLACTKTLEEIKAKYLPDLDLNQFLNYDTNAMESVHPLVKGTVQSFIDTALAQQGTMEGKGNRLNLARQPPPPSQAQEETMEGIGNQLHLAPQPPASQAQEEPKIKRKGNQLNLAPQPPPQAQEEPTMEGNDNPCF